MFGNPPTGSPSCWGRVDSYNSEDRECRGCGFQNTCRNQVIKLTLNNQQAIPQMPIPAPQYYSSYQPAVAPAPNYTLPTHHAPAPIVTRYVPPQPAPIPVYQSPRPPVHQQQQMAQPQQPQQQIPAVDWYGRTQDPLFFHVLSPPPFRPQMPGEQFGERLMKNIILDIATLFFGHLMLGARQMILPPQPDDFNARK